MKKSIKLVMAAFAVMLASVTSAFAYSKNDVRSFFYWIEQGNASQVYSYIVDKGLDPNKTYTVTEDVFYKRTGNFETKIKMSGMLPLFYASKLGKADVVKCLIQKGADVDIKNSGGNRPITTAAYRGYLDVVKILVYNDCEVNVKGGDGKTPLQNAEEQEHFKVVKFLKEQANKSSSSSSSSSSAKADTAAFITAADKGDLETVKKQVSLGVDLNATDKDGWTALQSAAYQGRTDVVKYLISKGADINKHKKNKEGKNNGTALFFAARQGKLDCVKALVEAKADINAKDVNGITVLAVATEKGHTKVVEYLKSKGAK